MDVDVVTCRPTNFVSSLVHVSLLISGNIPWSLGTSHVHRAVVGPSDVAGSNQDTCRRKQSMTRGKLYLVLPHQKSGMQIGRSATASPGLLEPVVPSLLSLCVVIRPTHNISSPPTSTPLHHSHHLSYSVELSSLHTK